MALSRRSGQRAAPASLRMRTAGFFAGAAASAVSGVSRGAAALDLCYMAAGYTDGFFETGLSPWDIAAGSLMVTEAGGLIGNFTGEADYLYQREVLAASPKIYGQMVPLLSPFTRMIAADETPEHAPIPTLAAAPQLTPEAALAAAPVKKPAVRIRKDAGAAR